MATPRSQPCRSCPLASSPGWLRIETRTAATTVQIATAITSPNSGHTEDPRSISSNGTPSISSIFPPSHCLSLSAGEQAGQKPPSDMAGDLALLRLGPCTRHLIASLFCLVCRSPYLAGQVEEEQQGFTGWFLCLSIKFLACSLADRSRRFCYTRPCQMIQRWNG